MLETELEIYNANTEHKCDVCAGTIKAGENYLSDYGHAHYGKHIHIKCKENN